MTARPSDTDHVRWNFTPASNPGLLVLSCPSPCPGVGEQEHAHHNPGPAGWSVRRGAGSGWRGCAAARVPRYTHRIQGIAGLEPELCRVLNLVEKLVLVLFIFRTAWFYVDPPYDFSLHRVNLIHSDTPSPQHPPLLTFSWYTRRAYNDCLGIFFWQLAVTGSPNYSNILTSTVLYLPT
jgi:hypothetical protein